MRVGGAGCTELVPYESGVGTARVLLAVCPSIDLSSGIANLRDAVDGVQEGSNIVSRAKYLETKSVRLGVQQFTA